MKAEERVIAGMSIFLLGVWGGSWLASVVPPWAKVAAVITGAFFAVIGFALMTADDS